MLISEESKQSSGLGNKLVTRFFCLSFQDFESSRKDEKERNTDVRAKRRLAAQNQQPFNAQEDAQPTEPHWPRQRGLFIQADASE